MSRWMASLGILTFSVTGCVVAEEEPDDGGIESVQTLGVALSADTFCKSGAFQVTIQPRDAQGHVLAPQSLSAACSARGADGRKIACDVSATQCTEGTESTGRKSVTLMILDDSGSMSGNDPEQARKQACIDFVNGLGPDDAVAVTDYGPSPGGGIDKGTQELRVLELFTSDKQKALAACEKVVASGGTPLYESVKEGIELLLVDAQAQSPDANFALLLLSDGKPNDDDGRTAAIDAAKQHQIPMYTVGLGPAAEGSLTDAFVPCSAASDCALFGSGSECKASSFAPEQHCFMPSSDPGAVRVLQELASESGGTYAAATDPAALKALFANVSSAVREGKCSVDASLALSVSPAKIGERIEGTLSVGSGGAKTDYHFTVPASDAPGATLCQ